MSYTIVNSSVGYKIEKDGEIMGSSYSAGYGSAWIDDSYCFMWQAKLRIIKDKFTIWLEETTHSYRERKCKKENER
tara:strand:+ start:139 stop:366 length:228 start_codon:yes stop_codon:yes gene_type:complete